MRILLLSLQITFLVVVGFGISVSQAEPMEVKKNPAPPLLLSETDPLPVPKKKSTPEPKKSAAPANPMKVETKDSIKPLRFDVAETKTFEQLWIAHREGTSRAEMIRIGLYNHTDRELILEVDGKPLKLPSLHYWLVQRPRSFTWREKEGDLHKILVPTDVDGVEVIFKK